MINLEQKAKELEAQLPKQYPNFYELYADNRELLKGGYKLKCEYDKWETGDFTTIDGLLAYSDDGRLSLGGYNPDAYNLYLKFRIYSIEPHKPKENPNLITSIEQFKELVYQAQSEGKCLEVNQYFNGVFKGAYDVVGFNGSFNGALIPFHALVKEHLKDPQPGVTFEVKTDE